MAENKGTTSKNEQWNKAVAKATGGDVADPGANAPTLSSSATLVRKEVDKAVVDAIMNDPALEFAPQIYSLEQGDLIEGILEGNGPDAEFEHKDMATGIVTTNTVQTWVIRSLDGRQRISILSSAQLDKKLPGFVGGPVKIVRGKDINTNAGRRVTDYLVAGPKLPNGQSRSWSVVKPQVIDATAQQAALPAAGNSTPESATH